MVDEIGGKLSHKIPSLPPPLSAQNFIFIISGFMAWAVPDVPQSVKNEIQKEKLLAFEAIHARQDAGKDLGIKQESASPTPAGS